MRVLGGTVASTQGNRASSMQTTLVVRVTSRAPHTSQRSSGQLSAPIQRALPTVCCAGLHYHIPSYSKHLPRRTQSAPCVWLAYAASSFSAPFSVAPVSSFGLSAGFSSSFALSSVVPAASPAPST